jgi:hypothetical protein
MEKLLRHQIKNDKSLNKNIKGSCLVKALDHYSKSITFGTFGPLAWKQEGIESLKSV